LKCLFTEEIEETANQKLNPIRFPSRRSRNNYSQNIRVTLIYRAFCEKCGLSASMEKLTVMKVPPPYRNNIFRKLRKLREIVWIRKALGYTSIDPVIEKKCPLMIRNRQISYHDLFHIEVSKLKRIKIGQDMVSGIHGINSPYFHEQPIIEEYDSSLDEARIAVHEWLTRTSIANTLKIFVWICWFMLNDINPIHVIWQHYQSLKSSISPEKLGKG